VTSVTDVADAVLLVDGGADHGPPRNKEGKRWKGGEARQVSELVLGGQTHHGCLLIVAIYVAVVRCCRCFCWTVDRSSSLDGSLLRRAFGYFCDGW